MESTSSLRNKYGVGYFTVADDQNLIRWKPLSMEDYFYYDRMSKDPEMVPAVLEDEIFRKCVLDKHYIDDMDRMPFGTVSIVAQNIMEHSGPLSIDHFNAFLDSKRAVAMEPLHHLVMMVVRAFPGYKPEDVYAMSFDTFMLRVAQAEQLLMHLGIITEPFMLEDASAPKKQKRRSKLNQNPPSDLKAAWDQQQKPQVDQPRPIKVDKEPTGKGVKFEKVNMEDSAIFKVDKKHPEFRQLGNLDVERITTEQAVQTEEESELRAKMVKEAQTIYAPVMNKMEFYKKAKK